MLIDSIKDDEIIDIQVNGSFYRRVQALFFHFISEKDPEYIKKAIESINAGTADNEIFTAHLQTITVLMREIEEQAKTQGKISQNEINTEGLSED